MATGFKVADAYVEIHTEDDTRTGRQKVERDTSSWARALGLKLGRTISAGLLAGIGRALMQALAQTAKLAAFGLVAGVVASAIGGLAAAIANLIPIIAELVNVLIAASGTLLLLPGAILTLISLVATLKLGMKGMGDAMKAVASGDAAALNEALKKLAPNARAFVKEVARIKPAFDRLRLRIQNQLFAGLARSLRELARLTLPILLDRFDEMARVLNGAIRDAILFLSDQATRNDLTRMFNQAAIAVRGLSAGLIPILRILRDIAAVGIEVLAQLSQGFGRVLEGWADDIAELRESGGLEELIRDGLAAAKALALLLGDIVGIIRGLTRAAGGAGGLFSFFDRLNRLINSFEGQTVLKDLFNDLDRIGRALIPVLMALLKALLPVIDGIADIAEAFTPGLTILLLALGDALSLLAEPISALAPLMSALARGLGPLASILGELVMAATPGLTAFLEALVDALIALVPVAPVVGKALGDLFEALAPLLEALGPTLAVLLTELALGLSAIAEALGPVIALFAGAFGRAMLRLLPVLLEMGARILPAIAEAGVKIAEAFAPLIPVLMQIVEIFINQALAHFEEALPVLIGLIDAAAEMAVVFGGALLDALVELAPIAPDLAKAMSDMALAMLEILVALTPLLVPLAKLLAEFIRLGVETGAFQTAIMFLIGVLTVIRATMEIVAAVIRRMIDLFRGARDGVGSFGKAAQTAISNAMAVFRNLGSVIRNAVGNLRTLLVEGGKNVIRGLIDGINAMWESLKARIRDAAQMVRNFWPFSPAKEGPLSGRGDLRLAGQNLVDRLTGGIADRMQSARSSAASLAGLFAGPIGGPLDLAAAPAGAAMVSARAAAAAGSYGPYVLLLDEEVVAKFSIDAVTGVPQVIAATVDEGRRKRGFANPARARR